MSNALINNFDIISKSLKNSFESKHSSPKWPDAYRTFFAPLLSHILGSKLPRINNLHNMPAICTHVGAVNVYTRRTL